MRSGKNSTLVNMPQLPHLTFINAVVENYYTTAVYILYDLGVERWVKIDKTFYPEKNNAYDKLFTIYLKSYSSLKNIFGELYEV